MQTNKNEQAQVTTAQTATAETNNGATEEKVSLGKFKDAKALLEAYNSLEAEFTKRCQRIKELEATGTVDKTEVPTENLNESAKEKDEILKEYLKEVLGAKAGALILDGVGKGLKTPVNRPKTIEEAGKLASELLAK